MSRNFATIAWWASICMGRRRVCSIFGDGVMRKAVMTDVSCAMMDTWHRDTIDCIFCSSSNIICTKIFHEVSSLP